MGDVGMLLALEVDLGIAVAAAAAEHRVCRGWGLGIRGLGSGLRGGGSPGLTSSGGVASAFAWKLLIDAQAFTSVPATENWSSNKNGAISRWARIAALILRDIAVVTSRSRFLVNAVGSQTGSSMPRPTNQSDIRL